MEKAVKNDPKMRVYMELSAWREAVDRDELWMYVDRHWEKSAPEDLTESEWELHFAARFTARTGNSRVKAQ